MPDTAPQNHTGISDCAATPSRFTSDAQGGTRDPAKRDERSSTTERLSAKKTALGVVPGLRVFLGVYDAAPTGIVPAILTWKDYV